MARPKLTVSEKEVLALLKKGDASRQEIHDAVSMYYNDRQIRMLKESLTLKGYPVGSNSTRGYFLIKTLKDKRDASVFLQKQLQGIARRIGQINAVLVSGRQRKLIKEA